MFNRFFRFIVTLIKQNIELVLTTTISCIISIILTTKYTSDYVQSDRYKFTILLTIQLFIILYTLSVGLVFNHQNKLYRDITAWVYLTLPALFASFLFAVNFYYIAGTSYSLNNNLSAYWIMITFIVFNISLAFIQSKLSYPQKQKSIIISYIIINILKIPISVILTYAWIFVLLIPVILIALLLKVIGIVIGLLLAVIFLMLVIRFLSRIDKELDSFFNSSHKFLQFISPLFGFSLLIISISSVLLFPKTLTELGAHTLQIKIIDSLLILGFITFFYSPRPNVNIAYKSLRNKRFHIILVYFSFVYFFGIVTITTLLYKLSLINLSYFSLQSILLRGSLLISLLLLMISQLFSNIKSILVKQLDQIYDCKIERLEMNWLHFARQYNLGFIILTVCLSISLVPLDKFIEPLRTELVTTSLLNEEHLSLLPTAYLEHDFKTPYEDVVSVILTSKTTTKTPKTVHNLMNNFINKSKHYACTLPKRLASGQIINLKKTWAPCYFFPLNNEMNDSSRLQFILFGPNYNNIPLEPLSVITVDINSQEIIEQPIIFTYKYCSRPWLDSRLNEILKTVPNRLDALNIALSELIVFHRIPIDNISFGQYKYEVADTTFMCNDYLKLETDH